MKKLIRLFIFLLILLMVVALLISFGFNTAKAPISLKNDKSTEYKFTNDYPKEAKQIAYEELQKTVKIPFNINDLVFVTLDFNYDNKKDFIVKIKRTEFCGSGGCSIYLFLNTKNGYQRLLGPSNIYNSVLVQPSQPYVDLLFENREGQQCLWEWLDTKYEFIRCN